MGLKDAKGAVETIRADLGLTGARPNPDIANAFLGFLFLVGGIVGFFMAGPKMDVIRSDLGQLVAALNSTPALSLKCGR
jgi:hypothetical protein